MSRPGDWWVLDLERDPTPGDPVGVRRLAWKLQRVANDASATGRDDPGLSSLAVPRGTMDDVGRDAARYNEGVQVGPTANPAYDPYRAQGVRLDVVTEVPAASSVARANPQFGAGGTDQVFIPGLTDRLRSGEIVARGPDGTVLDVVVSPRGAVSLQGPGGSFIDMTNFGPNPSVFTDDGFAQVQRGLRDVLDIGRIGVGVPARGHRIAEGT